MYSKPFYITQNQGNNAFSYKKRQNKRLYIPNLIKIDSFDDINLGNEIVFEDYDFNGNLVSCTGLKNFYEVEIPIETNGKKENKKIYLFDNHNHAYFFWHKSRLDGIIGNNCTLYHIDEHTDMRNPGIYLETKDLNKIEKIFEYTNYVDVGNYIIPAIHDGLIKEMHSIRSESELLVISSEVEKSFEELDSTKFINNYISKKPIPSLKSELQTPSIILNLDLDFFEPKLDYIDYKLKKELIQKIIKKASVITVATSPFFIDQNLALKVFRDLFS
ncbi:MAG: UPF0489 family protein [Candidatus Gracilibacteria bacterium]|nr:UPF0489 family protein [Candidatus Gracilibacteria bacterium]